jgi:spore coat polysaccharide biosynthesis protein SpsF
MPVIEWIYHRCLLANNVDDAIIAIPQNKENQKFADFLNKKSIPFYAWPGDENNVISRVLYAAKKSKTDIIVDITGDCPMIDPIHIDYIINLMHNCNADYASNVIMRTWPDGLDVQVYKTSALEHVNKVYKPKRHVGWNVAIAPELIRANYPAPPESHWPTLGLTLDTIEDYCLLSYLFGVFGEDLTFRTSDVIQHLQNRPQLVNINRSVRRKGPDEG